MKKEKYLDSKDIPWGKHQNNYLGKRFYSKKRRKNIKKENKELLTKDIK